MFGMHCEICSGNTTLVCWGRQYYFGISVTLLRYTSSVTNKSMLTSCLAPVLFSGLHGGRCFFVDPSTVLCLVHISGLYTILCCGISKNYMATVCVWLQTLDENSLNTGDTAQTGDTVWHTGTKRDIKYLSGSKRRGRGIHPLYQSGYRSELFWIFISVSEFLSPWEPPVPRGIDFHLTIYHQGLSVFLLSPITHWRVLLPSAWETFIYRDCFIVCFKWVLKHSNIWFDFVSDKS